MTTEGLNHLNKVIDEVRKGVVNADTIIINIVTNLSNRVIELEALVQANVTDNMLDEILGIEPEIPEEPPIEE